MAGKFGAFIKGIRGQREDGEIQDMAAEEEEETGYSEKAWLEYLGLDGIADTPNEGLCSMDELRAIMMIKRAEPIPESLEQMLLRTRDARIAKYGTKAKPTAYVDNSKSYSDSGRAYTESSRRHVDNNMTEGNAENNYSYEEDERITMTRARHHRR